MRDATSGRPENQGVWPWEGAGPWAVLYSRAKRTPQELGVRTERGENRTGSEQNQVRANHVGPNR